MEKAEANRMTSASCFSPLAVLFLMKLLLSRAPLFQVADEKLRILFAMTKAIWRKAILQFDLLEHATSIPYGKMTYTPQKECPARLGNGDVPGSCGAF